MLAKNRNIGHWWRFSGFFNMPNGAFFGRKVLRFYVRFLALFGVFELPFFLLFCVIWTQDGQPWDARTPDAGKQTGKILPVKPNPAQPLRLIFTSDSERQKIRSNFTSCLIHLLILPVFISLIKSITKRQKNAIHKKSIFNRRKNAIFNAKNHGKPHK